MLCLCSCKNVLPFVQEPVALQQWASRAECMTKEPRLNLSPPTKLCSAAPPTGGVGEHRDLRDYGAGVSPDE